MHLLRTLLTLCVVLALVVPLRAGAADPYEIHVIIPMTGSGGFLGKSETTLFSAFETYANQHGGIAGRPIKFVLHDDTSNPQVAVQLTNELVAAKVPVIVGASLAATCSAEIPVLKNGPLAFCLSNAVVPPVGGFMYAAMVTTANHVIAGLRYSRLRGLRKIAYIVSTDVAPRPLGTSQARGEREPGGTAQLRRRVERLHRFGRTLRLHQDPAARDRRRLGICRPLGCRKRRLGRREQGGRSTFVISAGGKAGAP
jgi:hypothetical protein